MKVYIVSRHEATIQYFKELFPNAEVIEHLENVKQIEKGSLVIGNLPMKLIDELIHKRCARFWHVSLNVPKELRGKELSREELEKYMEVYEIHCISLTPVIIT